MKKYLIIGINLIILVIYVAFFRFCGNVSMYLIPVLFVISVLNCILADSKKTFLTYNIFLIIITIIGILVNSTLYFRYVCYDSVGEAILWLEIFVAVVYIGLLTAVEFCIKHYLDKQK